MSAAKKPVKKGTVKAKKGTTTKKATTKKAVTTKETPVEEGSKEATEAKAEKPEKSEKLKAKIVLESFKPAFAYASEIESVVCPICRELLTDPCIKCKVASSQMYGGASNCPTITGVCGHKFHKHCLDKWLEKSTICPFCQRTWETY